VVSKSFSVDVDLAISWECHVTSLVLAFLNSITPVETSQPQAGQRDGEFFESKHHALDAIASGLNNAQEIVSLPDV